MEKKTMKQKLALCLVLVLMLACGTPLAVLGCEDVTTANENEEVGNQAEFEENVDSGLLEDEMDAQNCVTEENETAVSAEDETVTEAEAVEEESSAEADDQDCVSDENETAVSAEDETATEAEAVEEESSAEEDNQEPETEEQKVLEIMYVDRDTDIRVAADGLSAIVMTVPANSQLNVYDYSGYWAKVSYHNADQGLIYGYVYCKPVDVSQMAVEIFSSRRAVMSPGETVHLTSVLYGMDGYTVSYQWECDMGDGFAPVAGANSDTYSFVASVETLGYNWRLTVVIE